MDVVVEYAGGDVGLEVDEDSVLDVLEVPRVEVSDEGVLFEKALKPLPAFLSRCRGRVVVIVNDHTRPTPNDRVLEGFLPLLEGLDVVFLVASGTHPLPGEEGLKRIFGGVYGRVRDRIVLHDCRSNLVELGTTSRGTVVKVNRLVVEADRVIAVNAVESHYFAGFSGGRKSIVPGVAGYETVEMNHRWALDEGSFDTALEGNPVHEDMVEAALFLKTPLYSIQLVFDGEQRIIAVESGDIVGSFKRAVAHARKLACVPVKGRADVVVAVAPFPKDVDLYQAQQALEKGKLALKEGGTIILVAECRNGIGNDSFYRLLSGSGDPYEVLETISGGYKLGYHKAARIAGLAKKARIFLVSRLEPEVAGNCFMVPYSDPQKALDDALDGKPDARVTFLLNGFLTVPVPPA
jgi:nickel-dependent lactate racemase